MNEQEVMILWFRHERAFISEAYADVGEGPHAFRKASVFVLHQVNGLFTHEEYWDPPIREILD